ncbi:hypothetical protein SNOG_07499 [Parastagonospora nodorum SN15]|uniref:Uncharacterized protein n=1 Tax=Phaeosphaeria nodorum (strain SN15 / ATCC MYA-4574 / FGSC 10173) TaxID=321614 RepID=Q0UL65_PHANO|nr:hypothetical protein SNOG_07499 [Parastagonospora nodorum SN15]EAT84965.1 hypothetical protein SNOG_07499 [Parastagonospora nodorum SN15]
MSTPTNPLRDRNAFPNLIALHHVPHSEQSGSFVIQERL